MIDAKLRVVRIPKFGGGKSHSRYPNSKAYIFHCNAKSLALGLLIGYGPQCERFALPIPTCLYLKSLADPMRSPTDPTRSPTDPTRSLTDPTPAQREPVEYNSRWVGLALAMYMYISCFFVSISPFFGGIWAKDSVPPPPPGCRSHQ